MGAGTGSEHILLSDHGATVDVAREHGDDAWMLVSAGPDDERPSPCARLVERAVQEARDHSVRRIDTALDLAAPSTCALLQVLHRHLGQEISSVSMHRAGASAMVTIVLSPPGLPSPTTVGSAPETLPGHAGAVRPGHAAPGGGSRLRGVPTPRRRPWSAGDEPAFTEPDDRPGR